MNYYVVFQNKTHKEEHDMGILWAPQKDKNGNAPMFHWTTMNLLRTNDIVYSIVKNKVVAKGIVIKEAIDSDNPFDDNELWGRAGWLAEVEYQFELDQIKIMDHLNIVSNFLPDKYSPFSKKTGKGNQGYLFRITDEFGEFINDMIQPDLIYDPSSIFEVDEDMSNVINNVYKEEGISSGEVLLVETERPEGSNRPKTRKQRIYGRKIDFITKSKRDAAVGLRGEELVVYYEQKTLNNLGLSELANKVKWVAKEADGYGYDVLSFDENGNEKYIEVKTTTIKTHKQPFDISQNEVKTSKDKRDQYWIYRIYNVENEQPKFYKTQGDVSNLFDLEPTSFKAYFKD